MFEVLMLLGFLLAATSQLIPERKDTRMAVRVKR